MLNRIFYFKTIENVKMKNIKKKYFVCWSFSKYETFQTAQHFQKKNILLKRNEDLNFFDDKFLISFCFHYY